MTIAAPPALGFELNGAALGGSEAEVRKSFPSAHCQALQWKSEAADRRCDDSQIAIGGVKARVTVYLRAGAIQAFDVSFDSAERARVAKHLRTRWGAPLGEAVESISRREGEPRRIYKARWEKGGDHAVLTAQENRKRATLEVWRGGFAEEIYRVR